MTSQGECRYCKKTFKKTSISRHLIAELKQRGQQKKEKAGKSFLVKVEPDKKYYGASGFFLFLWLDGDDTMDNIDMFLRDIWLDCCGHLSAFYKPVQRNKSENQEIHSLMELLESGDEALLEKLMEDNSGEIPFEEKAKDILYKDLQLKYQYDFGTTTYLTVTVVEELAFAAVDNEVLLSRNEPLEILCSVCRKEPAVKICSADWGLFCGKCAKKHAKECEEFDDYGKLPVVNSPRMGCCGYDGGRIDTKRDGFFKKR
ncbi:hypothetical protein QTN47_18925 [Danxiaibacter flavus]|uniref:Uncharacterized protein n=1 Tax=Danxiaibacter flavus TaxID=3049108 RepID=A0ABV3ZJ43_9BACT|nr:hypothetical protein QNM32_18935 [Chitinophagaceae bacterium DXS]